MKKIQEGKKLVKTYIEIRVIFRFNKYREIKRKEKRRACVKFEELTRLNSINGDRLERNHICTTSTKTDNKDPHPEVKDQPVTWLVSYSTSNSHQAHVTTEGGCEGQSVKVKQMILRLVQTLCAPKFCKSADYSPPVFALTRPPVVHLVTCCKTMLKF